MTEGYVHPDFGGVTEVLRRVVAHRRGGGAAVCVYHRGRPVVDAWAGARDARGTPWERETVAMSFSTTKGVVATALHCLVDRGLVDYDVPVAAYWPEFAAAGKEQVTVRQLLSHSAGMHRLRGVIDHAHEMLDWDHVVAALAAEAPGYEPGTRHGYHGITFGFLVGEVIRRVTGKTIHQVIQEEIVDPLDLDGMFVGIDPDDRHRLAELLMGFGGGHRIERIAGGLERVRWLQPAIEAFAVTELDHLLLSDTVHDSELPALNGCFTARALARMYAALANGGELDGRRIVSPETLARATEVQTRSRDVVVGFPMRWRLGYHLAATSRGVLPRAFGHFGYGGSGAWGDPQRNLAVAMVCNRVAGTPFGDRRFLAIGAAAVKCAART
ncbi:MAG: beta-lactamase family protein [Actinobacteria bacterium]|nr:beta-lactamase family protein [Actinomycetota bacterium]